MVSVDSGALCKQQLKAIGSNFMAISKIIKFKKVMNLKESGKVYMGGLGGRKQKREIL